MKVYVILLSFALSLMVAYNLVLYISQKAYIALIKELENNYALGLKLQSFQILKLLGIIPTFNLYEHYPEGLYETISNKRMNFNIGFVTSKVNISKEEILNNLENVIKNEQNVYFNSSDDFVKDNYIVNIIDLSNNKTHSINNKEIYDCVKENDSVYLLCIEDEIVSIIVKEDKKKELFHEKHKHSK